MSHQSPFEPVTVPYSQGTGVPETGPTHQNPKKAFFRKNKKGILVGVGILVAFLAGYLANSGEEVHARPDVNGLTVSAACETVREAGWRVDEVIGDGNYQEKSDCSDTGRKVVRASYNDYSDDLRVDLYFANEPLPEEPEDEGEDAEEPAEEDTAVEEATTEAASTGTSSSGYEPIYDEYAARLENECPTLSIDECAEIANEGVSEMADYMLSAGGTDGQYSTYETWSRKLMSVYIAEAQL